MQDEGEFKGLTLATTVWYEIFAGFHFCMMYFFFAISKTDTKKFIYNTS